MTSLVIDQTVSEEILYRIHWLIKFLRAMILNAILIIISFALYIIFGIEGLYFATDDAIKAINEQINAMNRQGVVGGDYFFYMLIMLIIITLIVFFIWIYISITKVWKVPLLIQSAFFSFSVVSYAINFWEMYEFSFSYLSTMFSVFVLLWYILCIIMGVDIVIVLWKVSRSPEKANFIATFDPRLTCGFWTYLNKLLDLPRTPFRNWWVMAGYILSLFGTIILIVSFLYLLSFGAVQNKLQQLYFACDQARMAACYAQSLVWAQQILIGLVLSIVGLRAGTLMQSVAKRLGALSISDVLKKTDDRFVLYLRPFDADEVTLPKPRLPLFSKLLSFRPFPARLEEELFDVSDGYCLLIAIGKPGRIQSEIGGIAYRIYLDNQNWRDYVDEKIRCAESIVILLKDTDGVRWELSRILNQGAASKTLFLFDPIAKDPDAWQKLVKTILPLFEVSGLIPPRFSFEHRPIGFFFKNSGVVEIENRNWTTTSYRTAFSHFLADLHSFS
jgi:hypothetical protein